MANIFENQFELVESFAEPPGKQIRSFDIVVNEETSKSVSLLKCDPRYFGHFHILGIIESIINSNLESELSIERIFARKFNELSLRVVLVYKTGDGRFQLHVNSFFFDNIAEITALSQGSKLVWPHDMAIYEMGLNSLELEAISENWGLMVVT